MNPLAILEVTEQIPSKNDKIAVLKANKDNKELQELLHAALDFKRKFHMKKFDENRLDKIPSTMDMHSNFMNLLTDLEQRNITGNEAISTVEDFMRYCDETHTRWYSRVIRKDLRAGFSISSANKAGFKIPVFDVMLAKDGKQCKKLNEIISQGVYVSPKLDGYRCIAVIDRGDVTLYSRNGTVYKNFPSIVEELSEKYADYQLVLDGEIMSDDFQAMQKTAFNDKERGVSDVSFYVFGFIPFEEWQTEKFKMVTKDRLEMLEKLLPYDSNSNIRLVQQVLLDSVEAVTRYEINYIDQGFEGAMVLPNIPYFKGKKSNRLMKFKTMESQDCEVIAIYNGTGKYENVMGGIMLLQEDGKTQCDCGSGFTDADREWIWNNQDAIVGRLAEIKYQELTPDGVMRFPIFLRWRDDK